ncbi:MAG: hypothetical protein ACI9AR_000425 [Flavobacteriaceae bacterium]|jgi:hypothetical protein
MQCVWNKIKILISVLKKTDIRIFLFCFVMFFPFISSATVRINEVAWMGSMESANDEWIELYNEGSSSVNIDGWVLEANDGQPHIELSGNISAGGYFLLERTDDDSAPLMSADLIYVGSLGNTGEYLKIVKGDGNAEYTLDSSGGWSAGDNVTKETMQYSSGSWVTDTATPRAANSSDNTPTENNNSESSTDSSSNTNTTSNTSTENSSKTTKDYCDPRLKNLEIKASTIGSFISGNNIDFEAFITACERRYKFGRYYWNFGDGETFEGKGDVSNISHTYSFPGTYSVVLDYYDSEFSKKPDMTDSIVLTISNTNLVINSILEENKNIFISLSNKTSVDIDMTGWWFVFPKGVFAVPDHTMISKNATLNISIPKAYSGIGVHSVTIKNSENQTISSYPVVSKVIPVKNKTTSFVTSSKKADKEKVEDEEQKESSLLSASVGSDKAQKATPSMLLWLIPLSICIIGIGSFFLYKNQGIEETRKEKKEVEGNDDIDDIEIIELD